MKRPENETMVEKDNNWFSQSHYSGLHIMWNLALSAKVLGEYLKTGMCLQEVKIVTKKNRFRVWGVSSKTQHVSSDKIAGSSRKRYKQA